MEHSCPYVAHRRANRLSVPDAPAAAVEVSPLAEPVELVDLEYSSGGANEPVVAERSTSLG